ncbi:MAG: hypothetical protein PVI30_11165 [Myxococcales bacterium]|jgi:hypothetical protein
MAISADATPEGLAKKFFLITMVGVVVYVGLVVVMMSRPEKSETDVPTGPAAMARAH